MVGFFKEKNTKVVIMRKSVSFVLSPAVRLFSGSSSPVPEQAAVTVASTAVALAAAAQETRAYEQQQPFIFTLNQRASSCKLGQAPMLWSASDGCWSFGPSQDLSGTFDPANLAPLRTPQVEEEEQATAPATAPAPTPAPAYDNSPFSPDTLLAIARLRVEEKAARQEAIQAQFVEH